MRSRPMPPRSIAVAFCIVCAVGQAAEKPQLTWPDISYHRDIPLAPIGFATKLKWTAALWLPGVARNDLPLHLYPLSKLDTVKALSGSPVFVVLKSDDKSYKAHRVSDLDAIRGIDAALKNHGDADRILFGTPLPLADVPQLSTWRADLSALRGLSDDDSDGTPNSGHDDSGLLPSATNPLRSFDDLYKNFPELRADSRDPANPDAFH